MNRFAAAITLVLLTGTASAGSLFDHDPGLSLDAGGALGINSDDAATDYAGNHPIASLQVAYRMHTGTEAFLTAGLGLGGHEALFRTFGGGLRQRLKLGRLEPFVEAGVYEVGDEVGLEPALGVGAGIDARLSERFYGGVSAGHFFSNDTDEMGGLDWSGRIYLGMYLGAGYRR